MNFKKWLILALLIVAPVVCFSSSTDYRVTNNGEVYSYDLITKGPWIDSRAYATLALANTAAVSAGKLLVISQNYTLTANTTLTASVMRIPGGSFTKASTYTLTFTGKFTNPDNGQSFIGFNPGDVTFGAVKEVYPEWWGNNTTPGTTDMTDALASAFLASGAKTLRLLDTTYVSSTDQHFPPVRRTKWIGGQNTIIKFTGATDGIVLPNTTPNFAYCLISGIEIQTSNASGGKAINADFTGNSAAFNVLRDITISTTGSGRWTHGLYAKSWLESEIYSLKVYLSANIPIYIYDCNILNFYGTHLIGDSPATVGIDLVGITATTDSMFFGGTIAGTFADAFIRVNGATPRFYGWHIENNGGAPSLGEATITGTTGHVLFHGLMGGNFTIANGVNSVGLVVSDSEIGNVSLGTSVLGAIFSNCRMGTWVNLGTNNKRINCTSSGGYPLADIRGSIPVLTNSAAPSVLIGNVFLTGGTTTITNFTDGVPGQEIMIIAEHAITITDGTNIFLAGSANYVMDATDTLTLIQKADGKWYELSRSNN